MSTADPVARAALLAALGLVSACTEAPGGHRGTTTSTGSAGAAIVSAPPPPSSPAPRPSPKPPRVLGQLDARFLAAAVEKAPIGKLQLTLELSGEVQEMSVIQAPAGPLPAPVQALLASKLPGAALEGQGPALLAEGGRGLALRASGPDKRPCRLVAGEDGKLIALTCEVKKDDLPAPAKAAMLKLLPKAEITSVEKRTNAGTSFLVRATAAGAQHSFVVSPAGAITRHGMIVNSVVDLRLPPSPAPPSADARPGQVAQDFVALAAKARGVEKIKLHADATGKLLKVAVYHHDDPLIPELVRFASTGQFPGSRVRGYETEYYADRGEVFEADVVRSDNRPCEVSMQVDSTLLYAECDIREDEMPDAVAAAIKQAVPGGKLEEIERQNEPEASVFTVEITAGGLLHYVQLDAKGAIRWHAVRLPAEVDLGLP